MNDYYLFISESAYHDFKKQGVIKYDWNHPEYEDELHKEIFERPYQWMLEQYQKRINPAANSLVWLWPERPDLRYSGYMERGTRCYLVQVKLDPSDVLLSDFHIWHIPLNEMNAPLDPEEYASEEERQLSWERIFDPLLSRDHDFYEPDEIPLLQGVVHTIPISAVVDERFHIAR